MAEKTCNNCSEPILEQARYCTNCEHYQDWRRHFQTINLVSVSLTALVGLVLAFPIWEAIFNGGDSDSISVLEPQGRTQRSDPSGSEATTSETDEFLNAGSIDECMSEIEEGYHRSLLGEYILVDGVDLTVVADANECRIQCFSWDGGDGRQTCMTWAFSTHENRCWMSERPEEENSLLQRGSPTESSGYRTCTNQ